MMSAPDLVGSSSSAGGFKLRRQGDATAANAANLLRIMLVLHGAHSQGSGILSFLSTADVVPLRAACKELREWVGDFPWASMNQFSGSLRLWRASFPRAIAVNIRDRCDLADADFLNLASSDLICRNATRRESQTPPLRI